MPIVANASPDLDHVDLLIEGRISSREYVEFFRALIARSPDHGRMRTMLFDCLAADSSELTPEAVKEVALLAADESRRHPAPRRLAVVATPGTLTFGLVRQWELIANDPSLVTETFSRREDATAWLDQQRRLGARQEDGARISGP